MKRNHSGKDSGYNIFRYTLIRPSEPRSQGLSSFAPGDGKKRDPGNEVVAATKQISFLP